MNVLTSGDLAVGGTPALRTAAGSEDEEEFLMATFERVEIHITTEEDEDDENECMAEELPLNQTRGTLYVTTKRVLWIGDRTAPRVGYGWEVSQITLHAISRDPAAFPQPCLYCQIGTEKISEVRFVPAEDKQLSELFSALSKSAEMNPDDEEDEDDENLGGEGDWIYNEDEVENGARAAQIAAHLDSVLHIAPGVEPPSEPGQFDDADEDELL
ncbi:hypothetical protein Poli38472_008790 [Pythium oligandrum]|uniref:Chloride conductance regulatory protein ICln n=1 Tax=Pythium oligandrum TaxID=41045 RepID=A0A8K1C4U2_PYTOL|nr:hypothetical protein Poli38472_008790 [Pythium oligandrum]|eukprot:TMW56142.1 hypothetical protein Poli38472_008790 [Pythium oligandrum]